VNLDKLDRLFEEYKKNVDKISAGIVSTNKQDFLKLYAFYYTVEMDKFEDDKYKDKKLQDWKVKVDKVKDC